MKTLANDLRMAYMRGIGFEKAARWSLVEGKEQKGWIEVAKYATANVCKPDQCEHVANDPVEIRHTEDGIEIRRGEEVLYRSADVEAVDTSGDTEERLLDVLTDIDDGIACALERIDFDALMKLINMKAALLGIE